GVTEECTWRAMSEYICAARWWRSSRPSEVHPGTDLVADHGARLRLSWRGICYQFQLLICVTAITPFRMPLCSARSMLFAVLSARLRPRVPRDLRALTAPAPSAHLALA